MAVFTGDCAARIRLISGRKICRRVRYIVPLIDVGAVFRRRPVIGAGIELREYIERTRAIPVVALEAEIGGVIHGNRRIGRV